ncbi:MAG: hypothetical protein WEE66_05455 [Actinomycetota bacterium]
MTRDRNALLDRLDQALPPNLDAFDRLSDRRDAKARRGRVAAGATGLGVTAAIVVVLFAWSPLSDDGDPRVFEPGDSAVPLVAPPGSYYYVRAGSFYPGSGTGATVAEIWAGPDDSGRVVQGKHDERFEPGEFPGSFLLELSTDPQVLLGQLIQRGSEGGASPNPIASTSPGRSQETTSLLRTLQDILTLGGDVFLTPEQTAAAFEAAGSISDVTTESGVEDPFGRDAVRLSWVVDYNIGPGSRVEWYFEPSTGQFMGQLWVNQRTGEIEGASWIEQAGITSSIEEVPTPDASYVPEGTTQPDFQMADPVAPQPSEV